MTITYNMPKSGVRVIKQGDPDWFINANTISYPRAFFRLSRACPGDVARTIQEALQRNWLTVEANVYEKEITWEKLNEPN